jgi:hypothetical protein
MKQIVIAILAVLGATAGAAAAAPAAEDDIASKVISIPAPAAFRVDGLSAKPQVRNDPKVQGGKSLRVVVPAANPEAWRISLAVPINKPVRKGDKLVLAFWSRLEAGENGAKTAVLPFNAVQVNAPPWTPVISGQMTIGPEWKMSEIDGVADKDYAAGQLGVSMHLASAKQTIDFGPVFVLDLGQ